MVARMEELVGRLVPRRGHTDDEQVKLVKTIKNEIIGNKHKKLSYIKLGAVPRLLELLGSCDGADNLSNTLRVQCAAAVGSFSCVPAGVEAVVGGNGIAHLLQTLSSSDQALVAAGARSLTLLFKSQGAPASVVLPDEAIVKVVELVAAQNPGVSVLATRLLARCCQTGHQQALSLHSGVFDPLLDMLKCDDPLRQEAAADMLATLTSDNLEFTVKICSHAELLTSLLRLLNVTLVQTRLLAATCLTRILPHLPDNPSLPAEDVRKAVLQTLAHLLGEKEGGEEAPVILVTLVKGNPELQRAAAEGDAVLKLAQSLKHSKCSPRLQEGALDALAVLCATQEDARGQVLEMQTLPFVVAALKDERPSVRAAGCRCLRSLSRSIKALQTNFDVVDLAPSLLPNLREDDASLQLPALYALCNLVVECSPAKAALVAGGCVKDILRLIRAADEAVRVAAVWSLENLTYEADEALQREVLSNLDWNLMTGLIKDSNGTIQEKALIVLQNLTKRGSLEDLERWSACEIYSVAVETLRDCTELSTASCDAGLYVVANLAPKENGLAGDKLIQDGAAPVLAKFLERSESKLRLAALWGIINLVRAQEETTDELAVLFCTSDLRRRRRLLALRDCGVESSLDSMRETEMELDNKERAHTAYEVFEQFRRFGSTIFR